MSKSSGNYISAQDAVKKYGAEILRLWVAAEDYRNEIRISNEIMDRFSEAYRKIRNTCRFLLGALVDFNPDQFPLVTSDCTDLDRAMVDRFDRLVERVQRAYKDYEFHAIYHSIYNFCTVDLSSLYCDILKDRLYCDSVNGSKRRTSQSVLFKMLKEICIMIAPILSVTAEEIWRFMPSWDGKSESVFLEKMPQHNSAFRDEGLFESFNEFLRLREDVSKALELARKEKLIGQSLEAKVLLHENDKACEILKRWKNDLPFYFITSQVELTMDKPNSSVNYQGENIKTLRVSVEKAPFHKCARCWNFRESVGSHRTYPDLCNRCSGVMEER